MYAKVFSQIFDSSIAENYEIRHVFEDLLKLADKTGVVDMTIEAVARRTNVPIEKIRFGIEELMKSDPKSRSHVHEGKRLLPLDSRRDWGWIITNYDHYREIQDAETLRENWRNAKAKQRSKPTAKKPRSQKSVRLDNLARERRYVQAESNGHQSAADAILSESLP